MNADEFKARTKAAGLRIIRRVEALPGTRTSEIIGKQLPRSGTSFGANYRAACRARSSADFVAKMKIVEEELDESIYWIEILVESGEVKPRLVCDLLDEINEILAMVVASLKTVRSRKQS